MVKRSILLTLALTGWAVAGQISSADFIYTTENFGGVPRDLLEIDVGIKGKCKAEPIKKEGKEIEVKFIDCKLPKVYKVSKRGEFVRGALLKPAGQDTLLKVKLAKPGTLKVEEGKFQVKLKIYEGGFFRPKFNVIRTVQGEEVVVELPTQVNPEFNKIGNRLFIKLPNLKFEPLEKKIPAKLVEKVKVKNAKGEGLIELVLSPEVAATQVTSKGKSLFITLYGSTNSEPKGQIKAQNKGPKVALRFTNANVRSVVRAIANIAGVNVVFDPEVKGQVNVDFKNPVYWKDALKAVLEPLNLTFVETPEYYRILPKSKLVSQEKLEPVQTFIIPLSYVNAGEIIKDLNTIIKSDERESITFNKDTNSLILKVTQSHYNQIREIVKKLDKPLKQVLVKAKIVQISTKAEKDLGFTWFISGFNRLGDSTNSTYVASTYGFNTQNYPPLITPDTYMKLSNMPVIDNTLALGILNKSQTLKVELALKAMELDGDAQIISSPKVLTLDNQEASIEQGIEIPYTESTVGAGGATSYNINFKKASLILKVKPHITRDGKIILDLEVRKDSPNYDYVTITGSNEPAINTRNVKSKVIVENGSTVVIGGIYEKEKSKTTTGVPVLSRIPLLGWLFKSTNTIVSKNQLLIFITPTLVNPEGTEITGRAK